MAPRALAEAAVFALAGLGFEVVYTALAARASAPAEKGRHLIGYSSVWYLPLYAQPKMPQSMRQDDFVD